MKIRSTGIFRILLALVCLYGLAGCRTAPQANPSHVPNFFVEAIGQELKNPRVASVQLPISASVIQIKPVPSLPHFDLDAVTLEQGAMGPYLRFAVKPEARLRLMELAGTYLGRRLVLVLGAQPMGAWRIDRIPEDGTLAIHVEVDDSELPALTQQIRASLRQHP